MVLRISRLDRAALASEEEQAVGGGVEWPLEPESTPGAAEPDDSPDDSPRRAGLEGLVSRTLQVAAALVQEEQAAREARKAAEETRLLEFAAGSKARRRGSHEGGAVRRDNDLLAGLAAAPADRSAKVVYRNASISLRLQDAGSATYIVDGLELLPFKVVCTVRLEAPPGSQEGARVDADLTS